MTVTTETKETTVKQEEINVPNGYYSFQFANTQGYTKITDEGMLVISNKPSMEWYKGDSLTNDNGFILSIFYLKREEERKPVAPEEFEAAFTATLNVLGATAGVDLHKLYSK